VIGIIFGPPGSGKGTQAVRMEQDLHLKHLSTGEMLRGEVAQGTSIGERVGRIMAAGDLVPDDLIVDMVRRRLPEAEEGPGVLLDGFPRTVAQARALDSMLSGEGHAVNFIVALAVPENVLVDRILHRAAVEGRADDTREAIAERMNEYRTRTEAVLDHYRKQGARVEEIDGVGSPDEVFDRIRAQLASRRAQSEGGSRPRP
jgi:adenylate kinase